MNTRTVDKIVAVLIKKGQYTLVKSDGILSQDSLAKINRAYTEEAWNVDYKVVMFGLNNLMVVPVKK